MVPTRREFVAGAVAILSTGVQAGSAQSSRSAAPGQGTPGMWARIDSELFRIQQELRANPNRVDSMRAFESTLRILSTYVSDTGVNQIISSQVKRMVETVGRDQLASKLIENPDIKRAGASNLRSRFPGFRPDEYPSPALTQAAIDRAVDRLSNAGYSASLQEAADAIRELSAKMGTQKVRNNFAKVRFGPCDELRVITETAWAEAGFLTAASFYIPVLAPVAAEATLIAVGFSIALGICEYWL